MATMLDGDEWLYPPYSVMDCLWGAILAVLLVALVVGGWRSIRTRKMQQEWMTFEGWPAVALGWMQVILGLGLGLLIAGALIRHFFLEPSG